MNRSIVSPSTAAVKPRRHQRILRDDIAAREIDPALKAELDAVNRLDFGHYCEKLLHFREQREGV